MSISYNSITTCVCNVQVSEENTSENGSVYKVSGETDAIGKDIPFSCSYIKPTEVICEEAQREVFDLIQEIIFSDNTLILKGISKENQYWMEYYITEGQWVLL